MSADDAIQLLRRHDPASRLDAVPVEVRERLCHAVIASDRDAAELSRMRSSRRTFVPVVVACIAALALGVGVAWAAGVLSPLAIFQDNMQQQGAAPGSLWDQRVVPSSVVEAATLDLPKVGAVRFWFARSAQGGWCGALQFPSGAWVGTGEDELDAGGTVPGCFPTRSAVNRSGGAPVYVIDGFDYQEGDVDARPVGGSFWRIRYGEITVPHAVRVADLVSGRSAVVTRGGVFALAIPDADPEGATAVHLVAYDASDKLVADNCPRCPA